MSLASKRHRPPNRNDSFLLFLPPLQLSSSEEVLTYASMIFKAPKENDAHLTKSVQNAVYSDPAVYAQVKVTNSPCLSSEA